MSQFLRYSLLILFFLIVIVGFGIYWNAAPKFSVEDRSPQLAQVSREANTVYVDGKLASDCLNGAYSIKRRDCSGNDGTAYTHPQVAARDVSAGKTVLIRGGTYLTHPRSFNGKNVLWITTTGLPDLPIRFENYNGERVVLDNQRAEGSVVYIDGRNRGDGTNYIELVGLAITGGAARGDTLAHGIHARQSRFDLIERNEIYQVEGIAVFFDEQQGIYPDYGHHTVRRNNIHDNYNGVMARATDYILIEENYIHHNVRPDKPGDSDGVGGVGDFSIIRGNVIHNNSDDNIDAPGLGYKPSWYTKGREPENVIIEKNVLYQAGEAYGYQGDGSGLKSGTHESGIRPSGANIIRYNIAFKNDLRGLEVAGNYRDSERDQLPPPNLYYGNTIFDNGDLSEGGAIDGFYSEDADLILFNNISRNPDNQIFRDVRLRGDPHKIHSDFNNFGDRWIRDEQSSENLLGDGIPKGEPLRWDQNSQSGDPLFVNIGNLTVNTDLTSPNFGEVAGLRLQTGSPAIDAGVDVRRALKDLLTEIKSTNKQQVNVANWTKTITFALANISTPFPFEGLAPDLGAYESTKFFLPNLPSSL